MRETLLRFEQHVFLMCLPLETVSLYVGVYADYSQSILTAEALRKTSRKGSRTRTRGRNSK